MPQYAYTAKDHSSQLVEGQLEAESERGALQQLADRGLFPVRLDEQVTATATTIGQWRLWQRRVRVRELADFTRQLAELIDAGLPLLNALRLLSEQLEHPVFRGVLDQVAEDVRNGASLQEALTHHPRVFSSLYVNMVGAGELSGALDRVLGRLADFGEAQEELRSKVMMALVYPIIIVLFGIGTVAALLIFVIPNVVVLFQETGQALPWPTQILMWLSYGAVHYGWLILIAAIAGGYWVRRLARTAHGKQRLDRLMQRIPIFCDLIRRAEIARMAYSLSMLIGHGAPLMESLDVVARSSTNTLIQHDLDHVRQAVAGGSSIAQAMSDGIFIPSAVASMVAVGEEGGALESVFLKIATSHERQVERTTRVLTTLLEPLLILVVGAIVGFIVAAMLLPIFEVGLLES
jgi:type II secretory pathway component PulF